MAIADITEIDAALMEATKDDDSDFLIKLFESRLSLLSRIAETEQGVEYLCNCNAVDQVLANARYLERIASNWRSPNVQALFVAGKCFPFPFYLSLLLCLIPTIFPRHADGIHMSTAERHQRFLSSCFQLLSRMLISTRSVKSQDAVE